jgi:hypothetical protein
MVNNGLKLPPEAVDNRVAGCHQRIRDKLRAV